MATYNVTLSNLVWTRITNPGKSGTTWKKSGEYVVVCQNNTDIDDTLPLSNTNVTLGKSHRVPLDQDTNEVFTMAADNTGSVFYGLVVGDDSAEIVCDSEVLVLFGLPFIFEVKTTAPGETFADPLEAGGTYDFYQNHGDGQVSHITAYNQPEVTHAYASAGTHVNKIYKTINGWTFNSVGDRLLFFDISSIGPLLLGNTGGYFFNTLISISAPDFFQLTGTTSLRRAFRGSANLTDISSLIRSDTSLIENMIEMLQNTAIDQSLGSMNIASVTAMNGILTNVTLSTENLSSTYVGWAAQPHQNNVTAGMGDGTYNDAGEAGRDILSADGWLITDNGHE